MPCGWLFLTLPPVPTAGNLIKQIYINLFIVLRYVLIMFISFESSKWEMLLVLLGGCVLRGATVAKRVI